MRKSIVALSCVIIIVCAGILFWKISKKEAKYDGPMIDAHEHFGSHWSSIDDLISQMDEAGIEKVVLFGGSGALETYSRYPNRFIPFIQSDGYYPSYYTAENQETVTLVTTELEQGFMGVGEVLLRWRTKNIAADNPVMLEIADVAAQKRVPLNVHQNSQYLGEFERLLNHNENAIIIWAHSGNAQPSVIRRMLENHKNLYADLSTLTPTFRNEYGSSWTILTKPDGSIDPEWKALFEDFPDRFMCGGDKQTWASSSFLTEETEYFRRVLGQLDRGIAENIAYKNILRLLSGAV
jgi:Tat protein secretion system quality control protein TatD with DNase activity